VSEFEEAGPCLVAECALLATADVLRDGDRLTQVTMSTPLMPIVSCGFTYSGGDNNFVSNTVSVSDICIWTLPAVGEGAGVWGITLDPDLPDRPKRNFTAGVSVRDGHQFPGTPPWRSMPVGASAIDGRSMFP
jgi:hypothetical protein